jgi:hypothetical protein
MSYKVCCCCKNYYNRNKNKPILLDCGDTLCQSCINFYKTLKDEFECPICCNSTKSLEIENKSAYPEEGYISASSTNIQNSGKDEFKITIRAKGSTRFNLIVTKTMTVEQLKDMIQREQGYNKNSYFLSFKKPLQDLYKTLEYYGIIKSVTIQMIEPFRGGGPGGFGVEMADVSNEEGLVKRNYGKAQPWNYITTGLNLTGKCENSNCKAYGKEVDCEIGLGTFDLVGDCDQAKCPMCKEEITVTTCTFCKCEYKLEGKKKTKAGTTLVDTPWKKVEKDYEYYDPQQSGIVTWLKLIIHTKPL